MAHHRIKCSIIKINNIMSFMDRAMLGVPLCDQIRFSGGNLWNNQHIKDSAESS